MQDKRQNRINTYADCRSVKHPFDTDLMDDLKTPQSSPSDKKIVFTRRAFAQIHEYYGIKFKEYIQQNKVNSQDLLNWSNGQSFWCN